MDEWVNGEIFREYQEYEIAFVFAFGKIYLNPDCRLKDLRDRKKPVFAQTLIQTFCEAKPNLRNLINKPATRE